MPKLNKVFLAIVIALLVTAVAETIFIFVYKPPQTIPTPITPQATPKSTPFGGSATNSKFLNFLETWPQMPNETVTISQNINGTLGKIDQTTSMITIKFAATSADTFKTATIGYKPSKLSVFLVNKNGGTTPINIKDLVPGDNIQFVTNYDAQKTPDENSIVNYIIYKSQ